MKRLHLLEEQRILFFVLCPRVISSGLALQQMNVDLRDRYLIIDGNAEVRVC
jgi:hypothetical protein